MNEAKKWDKLMLNVGFGLGGCQGSQKEGPTKVTAKIHPEELDKQQVTQS